MSGLVAQSFSRGTCPLAAPLSAPPNLSRTCRHPTSRWAPTDPSRPARATPCGTGTRASPSEIGRWEGAPGESGWRRSWQGHPEPPGKAPTHPAPGRGGWTPHRGSAAGALFQQTDKTPSEEGDSSYLSGGGDPPGILLVTTARRPRSRWCIECARKTSPWHPPGCKLVYFRRLEAKERGRCRRFLLEGYGVPFLVWWF